MATIPSHPDVQIVSSETAWKGRFSVEVVKFRHRRFDGAMSGVLTNPSSNIDDLLKTADTKVNQLLTAGS